MLLLPTLVRPARKFGLRLQSILAGNIPSQPTAFISRSTSPYFNLALEDWIFRTTPAEIPLLIIYRNTPSVIIGRNQNPWKEINQNELQKLGIPFVRRRSGGGTVYHDLGNTNYSILVPRAVFDRRPNAELVAKAIRSLGPEAEVNDRNDIVVSGFKISVSKCSAYKIVNKRAYHHGTMLINAQLDKLGNVLRNTKSQLVTKGVESVRSSVRNLQAWAPDLTHDAFSNAVVREFHNTYGGDPTSAQELDESAASTVPGIKKVFDELQTWEWSHGQTPEFTHTLESSFEWGKAKAFIKSKHGIITECSISCVPSEASDALAAPVEDVCLSLSQSLVGEKYGMLKTPSSSANAVDVVEEQVVDDIYTWLHREM